MSVLVHLLTLARVFKQARESALCRVYDWDPAKHPRAKNGEFTSGDGHEGNSWYNRGNKARIASALERRQYRRRFPYISPREQAWLTHELNTHLSKKERDEPIIWRAIGDHTYTILNLGFNNYKVLNKIKIK